MTIAPVLDQLASVEQRREDVLALHQTTIERVIQTMHDHICTTLSLEDMADVACLSPYYFSRIFHQIVGIPPGEFLSTLRLEAAKQLVLHTSLSVTDICFEVGYVGLGSFTTRFTQLVGVPPRHLRRLATIPEEESASAQEQPNQLPVIQLSTSDKLPPLHVLSGEVYSMADCQGAIYMGLFPKPIPQGYPVSCTVLTAPGSYQIPTHHVPAGNYYLLVAAFPPADNPRSYLLKKGGPQLVAIHGPVAIQHTTPQFPVDILLRPVERTDPPLLSAVPFI